MMFEVFGSWAWLVGAISISSVTGGLGQARRLANLDLQQHFNGIKGGHVVEIDYHSVRINQLLLAGAVFLFNRGLGLDGRTRERFR